MSTSKSKLSLKKTDFDIVCVGSALRDVAFYSDQLEVIENPKRDALKEKLLAVEYGAKIRSDEVSFEFGGGAANTSVTCARLGLRAGILAHVGEDVDGDAMIQRLEENGVNTAMMERSPKERTGFSFLAIHPKTGDRTAFVYYGASSTLSIDASAIRRVNTQWFYVSSLMIPKWDQVMRMLLSQENVRVAWNPGGRQLAASARTIKSIMKRVHVLILNRDEALECAMKLGITTHTEAFSQTTKQLAVLLQSQGPEIVVITNGRKGTTVATATGEVFYHPAPKDRPVDTSGAGDCYGSSFVAGLIHFYDDVELAMRLAQTNTTALVKKIGAQNGSLQWKELPKRLKNYSVIV